MTIASLTNVQQADPDLVVERAKSSPVPRRVVDLKCAADIVPESITWLYPGWLPAGKLVIFAGDAGTGKTTLALTFAAVITSGGMWPDGTLCQEPGNVLIWSGEDNPDDTLVPRLIAAGADLSQCYFIDGVADNGKAMPFDPGRDMMELATAVEKIGRVSLLIVDPIVSAVTGDMHRANDVRRSLQSIVDFAKDHGCAVVGLTHFSKGGSGQSPLARVIGSQAFGALARMVLVAAKQEGGDRRVLARAKSNIALDDGGLVYSLEVMTIGSGIEATKVNWHGEVSGTAREILGDVECNERGDGSAKADAEQFLWNLLKDGPVPVSQIKVAVADLGYAWITIRRAKATLGVRVFKEGMNGGWNWELDDSVQRR